MSNNAETIHTRYEPCRCGCQGRDPQHRAKYRRILRNVRRVNKPIETLAGIERRLAELAEVRLPGRGLVTVRRIEFLKDGQWFDYCGWWPADL